MNAKTGILKGCLAASFLFCSLLMAAGQEDPQEDSNPRHTVAPGFGFTFIRLAGGLGNTEASGLFVPSVGLDYYFRFAKKWELGLMGNYELAHYYVMDGQIERDNALQVALVGKYNFARYWSVFAGGGIEIEPHGNLPLFRIGAMYSIKLKKNWAILPNLYFDFKENYTTWSLKLALAKKF